MPPSGRWLAGQLVEPEHVFPVEDSTPHFGGWQQENLRVASYGEEDIQKSLSLSPYFWKTHPTLLVYRRLLMGRRFFMRIDASPFRQTIGFPR